MHGAAIVPQYEIADAPNVLPCKFRSVDEAPELIEQRVAVSEAADRLAVHLDVGNDVNLREALDETAARFLNWRPVEIPQATAEGDQFLITEPLIADQHNRILVPHLNEPSKRSVAELREIDAPHFDAKRSTARDDFDRLRGVAFGRRCSGKRHLRLQSTPPFREHSTKHAGGNLSTAIMTTPTFDLISRPRRRGGAAARHRGCAHRRKPRRLGPG